MRKNIPAWFWPAVFVLIGFLLSLYGAIGVVIFHFVEKYW